MYICFESRGMLGMKRESRWSFENVKMYLIWNSSLPIFGPYFWVAHIQQSSAILFMKILFLFLPIMDYGRMQSIIDNPVRQTRGSHSDVRATLSCVLSDLPRQGQGILQQVWKQDTPQGELGIYSDHKIRKFLMWLIISRHIVTETEAKIRKVYLGSMRRNNCWTYRCWEQGELRLSCEHKMRTFLLCSILSSLCENKRNTSQSDLII